MEVFDFQYPELLWLLLLLPLIAFLKGRIGRNAALEFSTVSVIKAVARQSRVRWGGIAFFLRLLVLALCILALARPRIGRGVSEKHSSGIDILLALDISSSMLALDFSYEQHLTTRIDAARHVIAEFIEKRANDRIGLVAFARYPYLVSPLTLNHAWLMKNLDRLKPGLVEDGTAIGSAIGMCVNRLRDLTSKSRIVILLTDGVNNAGSLSPLIAAESAASLKTKVYTIAAGTGGVVPAMYLNKQGEVARNLFGDPDIMKSLIPVDEATLKSIAQMTGAKFFQATTLKQLKAIYNEIDTLEKTKIKLRQYAVYRELFMVFVIAALIVLGIEQLFANVFFRRLP